MLTEKQREIVSRLYPNKGDEFIAWAAATNANYCGIYNEICGGLNRDQWREIVDALNQNEKGAEVHREP